MVNGSSRQRASPKDEVKAELLTVLKCDARQLCKALVITLSGASMKPHAKVSGANFPSNKFFMTNHHGRQVLIGLVVTLSRAANGDHLHKKLRDNLQLPNDCVIHSLRHTFLTRFGEAGADAFTIKKVAGHSSVTISERYIHPTPEGQERAFERFANLNREAVEKAENDAGSLQFPLQSIDHA